MDHLSRERRVDEEWVSLLKEAKAMGLTREEIKKFLGSHTKQKKMV
ncbi:Anti-repressor SinI [Halobacillus karajensis]|uniref:Anti-repressor SinI n=1 Tax=Halobacillus karajensis TaxID=195088 RepID=A0A059NX26_9BACI|nr:anti-repressor SinI family protein [Halobacillus karajensis]CDQ18908.1 Anti-repressor SinI [Halobacillus karajensis]CDQ23019.1 Anti-repressor SinI [Halobacillus karajensis]CDQ26501.1 Anti-repressor SinI [Halobacillus karajensis]SEH44511.1 Anti-repressor SinI [Halobacillus karajensis]